MPQPYVFIRSCPKLSPFLRNSFACSLIIYWCVVTPVSHWRRSSLVQIRAWRRWREAITWTDDDLLWSRGPETSFSEFEEKHDYCRQNAFENSVCKMVSILFTLQCSTCKQSLNIHGCLLQMIHSSVISRRKCFYFCFTVTDLILENQMMPNQSWPGNDFVANRCLGRLNVRMHRWVIRKKCVNGNKVTSHRLKWLVWRIINW